MVIQVPEQVPVQSPLHPPVQNPLSQLSAHVAVQVVLHPPEHEELQLLLQLEQVDDADVFLHCPVQAVLQPLLQLELQLLPQLELQLLPQLELQLLPQPELQPLLQLLEHVPTQPFLHEEVQEEPVQPLLPPSSLSNASINSSSSQDTREANIDAPIRTGSVFFAAYLKNDRRVIISFFMTILFKVCNSVGQI